MEDTAPTAAAEATAADSAVDMVVVIVTAADTPAADTELKKHKLSGVFRTPLLLSYE